MAGRKSVPKDDVSRDHTNPDHNSSIDSMGGGKKAFIEENKEKLIKFRQWCIWYPDLFLDLITPEEGRIVLDFDQRVFLRATVRFFSVYGVFPRGSSKTFTQVLSMILICILFPNTEYVMSAQTKNNASGLLEAKVNEIKKFWPMLANEIGKTKFSINEAEVPFTSGSRIFILANSNSSKGQRCHRLNIEEAALLNNELYLDVLEPIPEIPRRTVGKYAMSNPVELNGQINFFTTSGYKGSDEYYRNLFMVDQMAQNEGSFVIGSDWQLSSWYGRSSSKEKMLLRKKNNTSVSFAQNYEERWVGVTEGALVNINKLLKCRSLEEPIMANDGSLEIYLGIDVARADNLKGNQSSVSTLIVERYPSGGLKNILLGNIFTIPGDKTFQEQALIIKKYQTIIMATCIIVDTNGLGIGLFDKLKEETIDSITREVYPAYATINVDIPIGTPNFVRCIYDLKPQSAQNDIIVSFMDTVDDLQIKLLVKKQLSEFDTNDQTQIDQNIMPFVNTDLLCDEISNLRVKQIDKKLSIFRNVSKFDKDRWASTAYGIWYIRTLKNFTPRETSDPLAYIVASRGSKSKSLFEKRIDRRSGGIFHR